MTRVYHWLKSGVAEPAAPSWPSPRKTDCTRGWPEGSKEFALERAEAGDSATKVSKQLWEKYRIRKTRCAVIGLVHRSGKTLGHNGRAPSSVRSSVG